MFTFVWEKKILLGLNHRVSMSPCAAGNRDLCDLPRWHLLNDISEHVSLEETEMSPLDVHDRCMHGNWFGWKRFRGSNCKHLKGFHMTNLVAGKFSKYEMLLLNLVSNLQEMSQVHHLRMFPCFAVLGASPPPLTCKPHADPLHLLWKRIFFPQNFLTAIMAKAFCPFLVQKWN